MAMTKELVITSIVITPSTGAVQVLQAQRIFEDGTELATVPAPAVDLRPGDALDGLPLAVEAAVAALWGQDWVQAYAKKVLTELAASQAQLQAAHAQALEAATQRERELAQLAQQLDARRATLAAARAELDEEATVLDTRAAQVSADRLAIAGQRDEIRRQKPELASRMAELATALPAQDTKPRTPSVLERAGKSGGK
ncbi:MAG: hypothetical protein AB7O72_15825 [Ramlibacter sp.]